MLLVLRQVHRQPPPPTSISPTPLSSAPSPLIPTSPPPTSSTPSYKSTPATRTEALARLLERLQRHPGEPESLASLVQVFRFCGMLPESIDAHKRAVAMDPAVATSIAHTLFLAGQYKSAIEIYGGRAAYYLDAAAWAALGDEQRAIDLLRERLDRMSLSNLMTSLLASLLAVLSTNPHAPSNSCSKPTRPASQKSSSTSRATTAKSANQTSPSRPSITPPPTASSPPPKPSPPTPGCAPYTNTPPSLPS